MKPAETTLWGLSPVQLHDRYWASRGVQVVRPGEPSVIASGAELFMLTDQRSLPLFSLMHPVDVLCWTKPSLLFIRLKDRRERGYRERFVTEAGGRFVRFERLYAGADSRSARVGLTRDAELARKWQTARSSREGWRRVRRAVQPAKRHVLSLSGSVYSRETTREVFDFSRELVRVWDRPGATIKRAERLSDRVWADAEATLGCNARVVGSVWVGAGRRIDEDASVVGPSILWDDPAQRPSAEALNWDAIEPADATHPLYRSRRRSASAFSANRTFDVVFSLLALLFTLPLYPFVMLAIWLEDGRPFFFAHRRETLGGREFPCIKFRSMRKDAEKLKRDLQAGNLSDGPQFHMKEDPRLTRVGRFLRKFNIDELPQFVNVLVGHMSVVGPRPSPRAENQFCPGWREARLSVKPGITGLWQIKRKRLAGTDFQEWIKYDIQYVEYKNWWADLCIVWITIQGIYIESGWRRVSNCLGRFRRPGSTHAHH